MAKKKVPTSIQMRLAKFLIGFLAPNIFFFTGQAFVDKIVWKTIIMTAFVAATFIVGVLFWLKIIKGRVAGGKARLFIFIGLLIVMYLAVTSTLSFFDTLEPWISYTVSGIMGFAILSLLIFASYRIINRKKREYKQSQQSQIIQLPPHLISSNSHIECSTEEYTNPASQPEQIVYAPKIEDEKANCAKKIIDVNLCHTKIENTLQAHQQKFRTVLEIWLDKRPDQKCICITNLDNPNLKWVKIYKGPYGNGKFYGYVMMMNAKETVNGEIFFSDQSIWYTI